jgi:hypothetical protein
MQGYVPGPDGAFAQSGECFAELEEWLASTVLSLLSCIAEGCQCQT